MQPDRADTRRVPRLLSILGAAALGGVLALSPWGAAVDRLCYDSFFGLRGRQPSSEEIVIVAIDEDSFDELDLQWPWPRSLHARLLDSLFAAGARTVALDLLFAEPSVREEDAALAAAIDRHGNVVLATEISVVDEPGRGYVQQKIVDPVPILSLTRSRPALGYAGVFLEPDGFVRRLRSRQVGERSLSLVAATRHGGAALETATTSLPEEFWINFLGPARSVTTVSYYQALDPPTYLPPDLLRDKLVFVGVATASDVDAAASPDHFPVPFSRFRGGLMSGVEIHSHATHAVLHSRGVRRTGLGASLGAGAVLAALLGVAFARSGPLSSGVWFLSIAAAVSLACYAAFSGQERYVSPVYLLGPSALGYAVSPLLHYWDARRQKQFLRTAFSRYLSPRLVDQLIERPDSLKLGGEEVEATILFLDMAGFTSFSEKLSAGELIDLLNRNLGRCSEVILGSDGMIDKYIGDCIMAVWGVPIQQEDHALRGCTAALEMQSVMAELARAETELTGVSVSVRMGINSGTVVAGNVGGGQRFSYTVLGNEVNLAARLEGINKIYGTRIIVSEATASRVDGALAVRELDVIRVKGQRTSVRIFELRDGASAARSNWARLDECFQEGRALYRERRFSEARDSFERALGIEPDDGPAKAFGERCRTFSANPPGPDWDGVYDMLTK